MLTDDSATSVYNIVQILQPWWGHFSDAQANSEVQVHSVYSSHELSKLKSVHGSPGSLGKFLDSGWDSGKAVTPMRTEQAPSSPQTINGPFPGPANQVIRIQCHLTPAPNLQIPVQTKQSIATPCSAVRHQTIWVTAAHEKTKQWYKCPGVVTSIHWSALWCNSSARAMMKKEQINGNAT